MLYILMGLIACALGIYARVTVEKRKFERTNESGVLEFEDYRQSYRFALKNRLFSMGAVILVIVGASLIVFGFAAL
ncbi:hypothetical protein [Salipiger thiooxidans]|uniref:hypothetical protein n=1 Tax=Salipiger thiooxidans TaxID=282683 RepID=UPI001CFA9469|nr:hypothetical protein [Salipiger thiooxidans]